MSTKIWTAYRLTRGRDLWDYVHDLRVRAVGEVKKLLVKSYLDLLADWENSAKEYATANAMYKAARKIRLGHDKGGELDRYYPSGASDFLREMYLTQLGQTERSLWDLTVAIAARKSRRGWLLVPYPGSGLLQSSLAFMERLPYLEDYHYQNSSDRPDEVSARAWAERAATWDPLLDDDVWRDRLDIDILHGWHGYTAVDPIWDHLRPSLKRRRYVVELRRIYNEAQRRERRRKAK